jgi:hypothetical protein
MAELLDFPVVAGVASVNGLKMNSGELLRSIASNKENQRGIGAV